MSMQRVKKDHLHLIIPILLLTLSIVIFPEEVMSAGQKGLILWVNNVIPSIFPFVVFMNMLIELNFFKLLGGLLGPVMRKVFNLPGSAAFIWLSSITSGYPVGAKIIVDMMEKGEINKTQAQHVLSFCNNSGPLFILGTVGIGMLGNKKAGYLLLVIHILSSIIVGLYYKFHYSTEIAPEKKTAIKKKDQVDIGKMLGNSVSSAMELMLLVGGFIILFSVIIYLFKIYHLIEWILIPLTPVLKLFQISHDTMEAFLYGFLEITNGIALLSKGSWNMQFILALVSFLIAWSGFSIHAQTASVLRGSGLNFMKYLKAKFLQGIIAGAFTYVLAPFFIKEELAIPTMQLNPYVSKVFQPFSYISILLILWAVIIILTSHQSVSKP